MQCSKRFRPSLHPELNFTVYVHVSTDNVGTKSQYGVKLQRRQTKVTIKDDVRIAWLPYVTDRVYWRIKQALTSSKQDIIENILVRRTGKTQLPL